MTRKLLAFTLPLLTASILVTTILTGPRASAYTFNRNNIIHDTVFDNYNSMSSAQIDAFLNSFPNSCISTNSGFQSVEPTGYNPSQGYLYGGYVSAGRVIYVAAQTYGLNPQVILATLQKEQSLVAGGSSYCNDGDNHKYAAAAGYGCPDGGTRYYYTGLNLYRRNGVTATDVGPTCVNTSIKAGFSQQVIRAAWLLKFGQQRSKGNVNWAVVKGSWDNSDDPPTCYAGPMTPGTWKTCLNGSATYFDGYKTIDGQAVRMESGATAALYWYTPHFSGNQNFFNIFTSWFGSTSGKDYDGFVEDIDISTGSSTVQAYEPATITITARNTGNQSWSNTNFPIRLGTWAPTNHESALYDSSWTNSFRPATLNQSVVLPGATGTFTFVINPPNRSGIYQERFNLVADGSTWFDGEGYLLTINITPKTYTWQMVSQSSTNGFVLAPGQTSTLTLVAKNTGNVTWSNSVNPVRLGTWASANRMSAFQAGTWPLPVRPAVLQESSVAPGQNGTFTFTITAPQEQRFYVERFNLVIDGRTWFEDPWMEFNINVKRQLTWQMVSQSSSNGFTLSPGQTSTLTLVAKNTGNVTWSNTTNPVRLGTWEQPNRSSIFNDGSWPLAARAAVLQESSVAPGQNGTFVFTIKAPATRKFYVERFNLAMDGVAWFTDPWMEFDILVQ